MRKHIFPALLGLLAALTLNAAEKPTVDSILERYVKEAGGREAVEKVKTLEFEGEFKMGDLAAPMRSARKEPNKTAWKIDFDGATYAQGFDGKHGWKQDPNGIQSLDSRELRTLKRNGALRPEIDFKEIYPNLQYKGTETRRGEEVHILESKAAPVTSRLAFSAKSGLLVGSTVTDGDYQSVSYLGNYKKTDGVMRPHTSEEKIEGPDGSLDFVLELKKVTTNGELKDDRFAEPR